MTVAHSAVSSDGRPRAACGQPGAELLTTTAQPIPSGAVVITVRGEVDSCTSPLLRDAILDQLRPVGPPLVVDLRGVEFFGAAGLTVLLTVREAAVTAGTRLCLVAHNRAVLLPLAITGLEREFDIHDDYPPVSDAGPDE